jgi:sensor histidine kinase YesM
VPSPAVNGRSAAPPSHRSQSSVSGTGDGVSAHERERTAEGGIGLQNVNERLRVIYGANYQLQLDSVPGEGTCVRIVIPELLAPEVLTVSA